MIKNPSERLPFDSADKYRAKILDVAAAMFAEQGYAGTALEQVIKQCKIGKDTFYRRFHSKLALFEAVVLHERAQVEHRFGQFLETEQGNALEKLEGIARWLLKINLENSLIAYKRIAFTEAALIGRAVQDASSPITDHMIDLISDLQQRREIEVSDPQELVMYIINSLVLGPMMLAMLGDDQPNNPEWQNAYFARTWPRILGGICR